MTIEEHTVRLETLLHIRRRLDQIADALREEWDPSGDLRLRLTQIYEALSWFDPAAPELTQDDVDRIMRGEPISPLDGDGSDDPN